MNSRYPTLNYQAAGRPVGDPRRSQQIDELFTVFRNTKSVQGDRSILEVPLQLQNGQITNIRILLPALFPEQPPRLILTSPLQHPCVDGNMSLNLPILRDWKPHCRLVEVLIYAQETLTGAAVSPGPQPVVQPSPIPVQQFNPRPMVHPTNASHPVVTPTVNAAQHVRPSPSMQHPPIQGAAGTSIATETLSSYNDYVRRALENLSDEQLDLLTTDQAAYDQFIGRIVSELKVPEAAHAITEQNVKLAKQNLERDADIQDRTNQIAIVKSSDYASMTELYNSKAKEYGDLQSGVDLQRMMQQLQENAIQLHEQSETVRQAALNGELATAEFVDEYMRLRTEYHEKDLLAKSAARLC